MLRNENPEYHEKIINILIDEYGEFSQSCEVDGTDSAAILTKIKMRMNQTIQLHDLLTNLQ